MEQKTKIGLAVAAFLVTAVGSFGVGYSRRKVEIKTVTQIQTKTVTQIKTQDVYKDRIVYKYIKQKNKDVVVHETTTKKPDGTVITDKTIEDKTKTTTDASGSDTKAETTTAEGTQTQTQTIIQTKIVKQLTLPDVLVTIGIGIDPIHPNLLDWPSSGIYTGGLSRRIFGPCYLGVLGQSDLHFNRPTVSGVATCGF